MRKFTVKLLDGTLVSAATLRDINTKVNGAPYVPPNVKDIDLYRLQERLKRILLIR